jgi:hypothetical protein
MSGFVYIWRDRKHNRYYIGSHWGNPDDGYICSSPWMKQAYTHRPYDFKRRILKIVSTSRKDLFIEESRYLDMIKPEEMKVRYYNLKNGKISINHWMTDPIKLKHIRKRMSLSHTGKPAPNKGRTGLTNISAALKARKKTLCSHCNKEFAPSNYSLWHGDLCKTNPNLDIEKRKQIVEQRTGHVQLLESRRKRSLALKGRPQPQSWHDSMRKRKALLINM